MDQQNLYNTVYLKKQCPRCGKPVKDLDKDTSSGREIHLFKCYACGWSDFIDAGVALWKAYEEASKSRKK